jgi:hypothetical protein
MKLGLMTCQLVLAVAALGSTLPPPAQAMTVRQTLETFAGPAGTPPQRRLFVSASPGEPNVVLLSEGVGEIVVRDAGSSLIAQGECRGDPDGSVACPDPLDGLPRAEITMTLGDGDDVATVGTGVGALSMDGGPGADRMTSGDGDDTLDGGTGPDILGGGAGDDQFHDLARDRRSDDVIDGGPGIDTFAYGGDVPIRVQMAAGTVDSATHHHRFTHVENVLGSTRADVMIGGPGPDILDGDRGADRIIGAGGADVLVGGTGRDVIHGGSGDDVVDGSRPDDRLIDCGPGDDVQRPRDDVPRSPFARFAQAGCERVGLGSGFFTDAAHTLTIGARPVRARGRTVTFDVRCPAGSGPCRAQVWLRRVNGRLLGRSRATSVAAGAHGAVSITCRRPPRHLTARVEAHIDQRSDFRIGDRSFLIRLR